MTIKIKVTKQQNVKVNGVNHVAYTHTEDNRGSCANCVLDGLGYCHKVPCTTHERSDGRSVFFKLAK